MQVLRGVSGTREPPPLLGLVDRIAPRPVLFVAVGWRPHEIPVNRLYRRAAGPGARLWALPEAGHTRGVTTRPTEYEWRVIAFLDRTLRSRGASAD